MGYRIKKLPYNKRQWKVQYCTYLKSGRQDRDIPETEYMRLGFSNNFTLSEANKRKDQLNAQLTLKRIEESRGRIEKRLAIQRTSALAFLGDTSEYENQLEGKTVSHWRACTRMLCELKIEPTDWGDNKKVFYRYFEKQEWSHSYVQKICHALNEWGKRVSKRRRQYFEPLQIPRYSDRDKIDRAYFAKHKDGLSSAPLLPTELDRSMGQLRPEHYNWLFISVWFGLRPKEIDELEYRIEKTKRGPVLWIYQSKLTRVPRNEREKPIPCVRPQQLIGLEIIQSGVRKRPLTKTVRRLFGERVTLYGGRKGFTDLMLSFGYRLEDISVWLGHRSIERTWRSYMNKQRVVFPD